MNSGHKLSQQQMKEIVKSARTGSSGSPFLSNTNTTNSRNSSAGNSVVSSSSNTSTNLLGHHNLLVPPNHMVPSNSAPLLSDAHEADLQSEQQMRQSNNLTADWKFQPHIARYYTGQLKSFYIQRSSFEYIHIPFWDQWHGILRPKDLKTFLNCVQELITWISK